MNATTPMSGLLQTLRRINDASDEDKETVRLVMDDVIDVVLSTGGGGGVFFVDAQGSGQMVVHLLGDSSLAPHLLHAAPVIYNKMYGVPDGSSVQ